MKLAALDVGTNTVLMLVVERTADGELRTIAELSRITRLGRGLEASGRLDPQAASATLDAIVDFTSQARALGAEKILTAATAALRNASDGAEFVARVRERAGIELEIISGETEAQLAWLAVSRGLKLDPAEHVLVVDIGGGSTELIRAEPGRRLDVVSLPIGSVRLTERIVKHDPPLIREAADLRLAVDDAIRDLGWKFHPTLMVGIAGTVTTICALVLGLEHYDSKIVHGHRLKHSEVIDTIARLCAVPLTERMKLPGMEPGRADVIIAGAAILERIMASFGLDEVVVSDQGVRWGLIWRELEAQSAGSSPSAGE
jgi:exopolyphosphatase/guanosine-5'-triphosphate,3'-diphosphate pyrophosphatase